MGVLADQIRKHQPVRNPPYRPLAVIDDEERKRLEERIGGAENYGSGVLQEMILRDPDNLEYKRALVSSIVSAEYAGIDAFGRNVGRWEDLDWLPDGLLHAMVRQTWDEVRHARLGTELLEDYGGTLGDYPDTLAGSAAVAQQQQMADLSDEERDRMRRTMDERINNPVSSLSRTNVSVEGGALLLFSGVSRLGERIDDHMMQHCYDYNWADEVVHVDNGDWFLKRIAEQSPDRERDALLAHAQTEAARFGDSAAQRFQRRGGDLVAAEIREFLEEETDRASSVLIGPLSPGYQGEGYEPDR
jgi:hypothetical protein